MNCERLEEVIFSGIIRKMKSSAFTGCRILKRIIFPEGLIKISAYAFSWCIMLKEIIFPQSLQKLSEYSFSNCRNLENIHFPDGNMCEVHKFAFYQCEKLDIRKRFVDKLYCELTAEEKIFEQQHCAISGDEFLERMPIILLKCKHFFKKDSLIEWVKIRNICPICRENLGF
jgi:hypothetical protein